MTDSMPNSKKEEGFTMIKHNLYDWAIKAKLSGREQKIIHAIIRYTCGFKQREEAPLSYRFLGDITGMGHRNAETIIKNLLRKKIIFRRVSDIKKYGKNSFYYRLNKAICRSNNASQNDSLQINGSAGVKYTPPIAVNSTPNKEINIIYKKDIQDIMDKLKNYKKNNEQETIQLSEIKEPD